MSTEAPLFYVPGATEGTTQWRARLLQVVNWGGFEGLARMPVHAGSTLISGASGSGKSTLLDAYIALMMPSDVAFNGASNDAVSGRARSAGQRNLISYLRGQIDTVPDATGRERPKLLRGQGRPTWGAVAMTFVDDRGAQFTALRMYHVPARATVFAEILSRFATVEGELDLAELEPFAREQFQPKALKAAFPALATHDTPGAFGTRLHTRLGIGANGDGAKALRLLARIQAGQQIRTVDELYKDMVLERPGTYDAADRAILHFDDLDASYQAMRVEQEKAELLGPITGKHEDVVAARAVIEQIDTFGLTRTAGNPVQLWSRQRELGLLETEVDRVREERRSVARELGDARATESRLELELAEAEQEHRDSGGSTLAGLAARIEAHEATRDAQRSRRADLAESTGVLALSLDDPSAYARAQADAEAFHETFPARFQCLIDEREALREKEFPLHQRRRRLLSERQSLDGRASRIRGRLHDLRLQVAAAAKMDVSELPFLAELIDLRKDEQQWRLAVETVLGASARTLLVPQESLSRFSRAIDPIRLGGRLTFQGVPLGVDAPADPDRDRIAGKLEFQDSPFAGWVRRHVSEPSRNARCVETARELDGPGYRVTLAGQTRQGSRGTHGRSDSADIIGFSSEEAIAEIDQELGQIEPELQKVDVSRHEIDVRRADLEERRGAHDVLRLTPWEQIDVAGSEARIAELAGERDRILGSDDRLKALQERVDELRGTVRDAREMHFRVRARNEGLDATWAALADRQDAASTEVERLEDVGIELADEQRAALDAYFARAVAPGDPEDFAGFEANLGRLNRHLSEAVDAARAAAAAAEADLSAIFLQYLRRFPDPNLGVTLASYPDYAAVLDRILTAGLHEQRETWRRKLMQWSGEDLVPLAGAMESCVQEIEERLEPINDILCRLPFGAMGDRLRITLRRVVPEAVVDFRRRLRQLASGATRDLAEDQLQARFEELQSFMVRIRRRQDPRSDPDLSDRDGLLDVRRHVFVTAERYGPDGMVLSSHSSLGDKSGGETQELIAFIVGAALRFRLGDDLRTRPRFAPVVIDEGFIKSDSEFAGRAVRAWQGLGFQLLIGAPPDKVSALEPHMDAMVLVTKNNGTGYSFVVPVDDGANFAERVAGDEIAGRLGLRG